MTLYTIDEIVCLVEEAESDEISPTVKHDSVSEMGDASSATTLLHLAVRSGNASFAKKFIDSRNDINVLDNFGRTPLALAVESSKVDIIKLLLEANADIYVPNNRGVSVLQSVVGSHTDAKLQNVIEMFLKKVKNDFSNNLEMMAEKLIEVYCPLHLVIKYIKISQVTRKMLNAGRSPNELEPVSRISALHAAVQLADFDHVKLLIERGANIHAKDCRGRTPLQLYDPSSDDTDDKLAILITLMKRGAVLATPAAKWPIAKKLLLFGKRQTVDVLLQRVSLFSRDDRGNTPLHFLICNNDSTIFDALRTKKFNVNACNHYGYTLLMIAAMRGSFSAVDFLLKNEADVNLANPSGFTALFYAYLNTTLEKDQQLKMIKLLLRHGADLQHELPSNQMTIFDFAKTYVSLQPVLDHLAMIEAAGHRVSSRIRCKIDADQILKTYYYCFARKQYNRTNWTTSKVDVKS